MILKKTRTATLEWFRQSKEEHPYKIKSLYTLCGISKQGHYQLLARQVQEEEKKSMFHILNYYL